MVHGYSFYGVAGLKLFCPVSTSQLIKGNIDLFLRVNKRLLNRLVGVSGALSWCWVCRRRIDCCLTLSIINGLCP